MEGSTECMCQGGDTEVLQAKSAKDKDASTDGHKTRCVRKIGEEGDRNLGQETIGRLHFHEKKWQSICENEKEA